jgi:hypothetical protein
MVESWYLSPQWMQSSNVLRGFLRHGPGIGLPQPSNVDLVTFSLHHHTRHMSSDTYCLLANTICSRFPSTPVHCCSANLVLPNSLPLERMALFFNYIVVNGKQYHASRTIRSNRSSFMHVLIPGLSPVDTYREILKVFQFNQDF